MKTYELRDLKIGTLVYGYTKEGDFVTAKVKWSAEFGKYYANYLTIFDHNYGNDSVKVSDIDYDYCEDKE